MSETDAEFVDRLVGRVKDGDIGYVLVVSSREEQTRLLSLARRGAESADTITARVDELKGALGGVLWMAEEWFKHGGDETTFADDHEARLETALAALSASQPAPPSHRRREMSEKPPCECIQKIDGRWTYRCECSNGGSAEYAASWVADENAQDEIARLTAENEKLKAALHEAADELDGYYRAEYCGDHPYSKRKLAEAMRDNPARIAITQENTNAEG